MVKNEKELVEELTCNDLCALKSKKKNDSPVHDKVVEKGCACSFKEEE